jgi:hypothetical protein
LSPEVRRDHEIAKIFVPRVEIESSSGFASGKSTTIFRGFVAAWPDTLETVGNP